MKQENFYLLDYLVIQEKHKFGEWVAERVTKKFMEDINEYCLKWCMVEGGCNTYCPFYKYQEAKT